MISSTFIVIAVVFTVVSAQSDTCERQKDFVELLDELIETKVNSTFQTDLGLLVKAEVNRIVTGSIEQRIEGKISKMLDVELENRVKDHINNDLANEPVIRTMSVSMSPDRIILVKLPSREREDLTLSDPSLAANSSNKLVAYRPQYQDFHNSDLGVLFFNMEAIFPCINTTTYTTTYSPTCGILTGEEDGFFQGLPFIQAADSGNNFRVFSATENIRTYGFGVQGCAKFNTTCFPSYATITIFCLLPRQQCG